MTIKSDDLLPHIECDLNARGWSGDPDDTCIYVFDDVAFLHLPPVVGKRIFAFMYEDAEQTQIVGCEATLERAHLAQECWRIRPDEATWYQGPLR